MLYKAIELHESGIDPRRHQLLEKYIQNQIEELIDQASKANELKPSVRLKIEYGIGPEGKQPARGGAAAYQVIKSRGLDAYFVDKIANIGDYLQFHKKVAAIKKQGRADAKQRPNG